MKELIEKLIGRLEEEHERCINRYMERWHFQIYYYNGNVRRWYGVRK